MADGCALHGGCPSDYIAVAIAAASLILLVIRAAFPFLVHKGHTSKTGGFWLVIVQIIGSFNLILSLVMSVDYLKSSKRHRWQSCYTWAVWFEGPLGFGLLMSCRIVQAVQLYHLFVRQRFPPFRSRALLSLILLPWVAGAACIHIKKPLNHRCHMRGQWVIPVVSIHSLYIAALIGVTWTIRHIEFMFHELKDLLRGIVVSTIAIGLWIVAYILNEVHEDIHWIQVASRFFLLVMASFLVLAFFSLSVSQPLLSQISLRKRESTDFPTMGRALGISGSEMIKSSTSTSINLNDPLDKLLMNKTFCQSFMAFADSCLAGESVHFYDEVNELKKIPADDTVRRIYMARHIIENYIVSGTEMEVNISHRTRQEILATFDLAQPDLFNHAEVELIQLMKTNLMRDYWSSMFFAKFREQLENQANGHEFLDGTTGWDFSPRPSCVQNADDPFHQVHKYA